MNDRKISSEFALEALAGMQSHHSYLTKAGLKTEADELWLEMAKFLARVNEINSR